MNEGDVNDIHITGCAAIALLCPVTGNTDIQKDKMGEEAIRPDKPRYTRLAGEDWR